MSDVIETTRAARLLEIQKNLALGEYYNRENWGDRSFLAAEFTIDWLLAELTAAEARAERRAEWEPIETLPDEMQRDGAVVLRPHVIYGAMDVRWKPGLYGEGKHYNWINGDYTTAWPDEAFLPVWMPLPASPAADQKG